MSRTPPKSIVLAGFMGTGKTTVGRLLARELGWRLVDTDDLVERRAGATIRAIFEEHGEPHFRALEREAVARAATGQRRVISTGGGVLLDEGNARRLRRAGPIVRLDAAVETILERTSETDVRPLLKGQAEPRAAITRLLRARRAAYDRADHAIRTDELSPEAVAIRVAQLAGVAVRPKPARVRVKFGMRAGRDRSYAIDIGPGLLDSVGEVARDRDLGEAALVVTSEAIGRRYAAPLVQSLERTGRRVHVATVPAGERSKSLRQATRLYDAMIAASLDRSSTVFALGGGMIGDLAGFVAATYMRGVAFVQVPTTLLAQVDAGVGGKVVVNHPRAKNLVGAFHQPRAVLADIDTLGSLSRRDVAAGMAEVIKHGAIADARLFHFTREAGECLVRGDVWGLQHCVRRSCEIKGWFVEVDELDRGPRALLNFGHTIGHGLEQATGFRRLRHGEAVALGMIAEAHLGEEMGLTESGCAEALREVLTGCGLPTSIDGVDAEAILAACLHDKKTVGGRAKLSLLERIGSGRTHIEAPEELLRASLSSVLLPA